MQDDENRRDQTLPEDNSLENGTEGMSSALDLAALTAAPETTLLPETEEERRNRLPPAARRALAEAEERRKQLKKDAPSKELGGRGGLDPARFGDWEIKGRAIDF